MFVLAVPPGAEMLTLACPHPCRAHGCCPPVHLAAFPESPPCMNDPAVCPTLHSSSGPVGPQGACHAEWAKEGLWAAADPGITDNGTKRSRPLLINV